MDEEKCIELLRSKETSCCKASTGDCPVPESKFVSKTVVLEHQEDDSLGL